MINTNYKDKLNIETGQDNRKDIVKEHFSRRSEYWDSLYNESNEKLSFTRYELKKRNSF